MSSSAADGAEKLLDPGLPGSEIIIKGLADLRANRRSADALLVLIALPRLRRLGVDVPDARKVGADTELELYALLRQHHPTDAYSRYNALLRRLVSFEQALEHRVFGGWSG